MPERKAKPKRTKTPRRGRPRKAAAKAASPEAPSAEPPITCWRDAEPAVARLGQVEADIAEIHAGAAAKAAPLEAERRALVNRLHTFAEGRPDDFAGRRRGVRLQAGRLSLRPASRLVFHRDREQIVRALQDRGLDAALFATTRVSQDVLATFSNRLLAAVGVERQRGTEIVIEAGGAGRPIRRLRWPSPRPQEPPAGESAGAPGREVETHPPAAAGAAQPEPPPAPPGDNPGEADAALAGVACPRCGNHRTRICGSNRADGGRVRRRRACLHCAARFSTFEMVIEQKANITHPDTPAARPA